MPPLAKDVESVIREAGQNWATYWNNRELDKVVSIYAQNAVYLPPHHSAVHGRDAIREYLERALEHGATGLAFEVTYIRQAGDLAYDVGTYTMNLPHDGGKRQDKGKYLTVWHRLADGEWKIVADAWSSDLPAA
jgi:uncharacterized protein (TIGR02246 family)